MKGLILCAGRGSRLWPITYTLPKHLIPLANKPALFYIIDLLAEMKIHEIGIVVGENKGSFQEVLDQYHNKKVSFHYIMQEKPLGIAHAVLSAKDFIKDEKFITILGDNLYHHEIKNHINKTIESKCNSHVLIKEVENPSRYGIVKIEGDRVVDVIEKPTNPPSNLALAGIYTFDKNIFTACENIKPSNRGEYELTDAMKWLIDHGYSLTYDEIHCLWEDIGRPEDILRANQYLLERIESKNNGTIDSNSKLQGDIIIGKNTIIKNSVIKGPVTIGEDTIIENANIGPYTSICNQVKVTNCRLENSIIMDGCILTNLQGVIDSSILERHCEIEGEKADLQENREGKVIQLLLGKNTKIKGSTL